MIVLRSSCSVVLFITDCYENSESGPNITLCGDQLPVRSSSRDTGSGPHKVLLDLYSSLQK